MESAPGYTFFSSIENFSASQPSLARLYAAAASPFERLRSDGSLAKKAALVIFCLALYSAPDKNVTYIVDFSGFKSENSQLWSFVNSYSYRTFFRFWDWKSSSLINLFLVLYVTENVWQMILKCLTFSAVGCHFMFQTHKKVFSQNDPWPNNSTSEC